MPLSVLHEAGFQLKGRAEPVAAYQSCKPWNL